MTANGNGRADVAVLSPFTPTLPGEAEADVDAPALPALPEDTPDAPVEQMSAPSEIAPVAESDSADVGDESGDRLPVRVDPDPAAGADVAPWRRPVERRPVVSPWLRDTAEMRQAARWAAGAALHPIAFHGVRAVSVYPARLALGSPRGAVRLGGRAVRWVADTESAGLIAVSALSGDVRSTPAYLGLSRQHAERVKRRSIAAAAAAGSAALAESILYCATGPDVPVLDVPLPWALANTAGVMALGWYGRLRDRPIVSHRLTTSGAAPRLTGDVVERALGSLGIPPIDAILRKGGQLEFVGQTHRDGPGWRAEIDLPFGVTVVDVMERRDRLASGLRRPLGAVWPEPESEIHPGRLILWVGDSTLAKAKAPAWPLLKGGRADVFAGLPFGTDQRLRPVSIPLMFDSMLIGAKPRMGKTFALRVVLLGLALDPRVELRVFELKGTGDLVALALVAHHYAHGADDETLQACMASLRELKAELDRRAKIISRLPKRDCPENKITPDLASRGIGLHPICLAIDECQELFSHPTYGKEAEDLCIPIMKRGPALGVMLVLATQRPTAASLPKELSANMGIRFCLRVMDQPTNDMILGTSMYKAGIRATAFGRRDRGIGWLGGVDDDPFICKSAYIDGPTAERVAERARHLREDAGTLSGQAAGETPDIEAATAVRDVARHTMAVFENGEDQAHLDVLADRLHRGWPELYTAVGDEGQPRAWTATELGDALRRQGVRTGQTWAPSLGDGVARNRRGVERAELADVVSSDAGR